MERVRRVVVLSGIADHKITGATNMQARDSAASARPFRLWRASLSAQSRPS